MISCCICNTTVSVLIFYDNLSMLNSCLLGPWRSSWSPLSKPPVGTQSLNAEKVDFCLLFLARFSSSSYILLSSWYLGILVLYTLTRRLYTSFGRSSSVIAHTSSAEFSQLVSLKCRRCVACSSKLYYQMYLHCTLHGIHTTQSLTNSLYKNYTLASI